MNHMSDKHTGSDKPDEPADPSREDTPDFEAALAELEALVEKLESGDLKLDESLQHFRRGIELTRLCQKVLDEAQQTVETLMGPDEPGQSSANQEQDLG
jgi:exodeoxyribonuclease VII small subunit